MFLKLFISRKDAKAQRKLLDKKVKVLFAFF